MLKVDVPATEFFDSENSEFIQVKEQTLQLEHSLISISKWESKWCKPFLSDTPMSLEETVDYIKCMTLNKSVDPNVYLAINDSIVQQVSDYISSPMTATTFRNDGTNTKNREIVTSELIYYWMIAYNIPFDCEKWHLNRLLTLVRVCNIKNAPPKKMSMKEIMSRNASLNEARRAALNSKG